MTFRRLFTKALKSYRNVAHTLFSPKYLLYTNVMLSMGVSTVGDLLEQSYELHTQQMEKYDLERTAQMTFSGSVAGMLCHNWYLFLDRVIIGRTFYMAMKKLMLDQCIASPIIIMSFFATVALFEDNPLENFTDEVKDKFWILYKAEWIVWPPAQIINFLFLPTRFRVLYDNTISLGYDVYTSNVKHGRKDNEKKKLTDQTVE